MYFFTVGDIKFCAYKFTPPPPPVYKVIWQECTGPLDGSSSLSAIASYLAGSRYWGLGYLCPTLRDYASARTLSKRDDRAYREAAAGVERSCTRTSIKRSHETQRWKW